jgi:tetratricopeptide (TPR) repeat protein
MKSTLLFTFAALLLLRHPFLTAAPPPPRENPTYAPRVHAAFQRAQDRWSKESNSVEAAWQFGRCAHDWADFSTNDQQRAAIAELGITACRRAIILDAKQAPAHYYLALNLGQLARTKLLGALKLIDEMEEEWTTAATLDPKFDYAGAHRALGILYRDAPGWPTSVGSEKKSRAHLEKAIELHPEYPGNRLALFQGYLEWGERKIIRTKAAETEVFLQKARTIFVGEQWALEWEDWDNLWNEIKRKADVKDEPQK